MTTTMKQVQFSQFGSPDVLQIVKTKLPTPQAGEVLIRIQAIGVNYADVLRRKNTYFQPTPLPFVLGSEVVGNIIAVGEGVTEPYIEGLTVLAILPSGGGYAEYVTAIAAYCIPLPPHLDAKAATALFVQGSTAQLLIDQVAGDLSNKTVLIPAAAGGVGSLLVQLAKRGGAKVIAACSTDAKCAKAKANGADETVNYTQSGWSQHVKALTDGKGVDIAFEMVGGDVYNETIKSLAQGGHIIVYGCASGVQGMIHPEHFVDESIRQSGFNLAYQIQHHPHTWQEALGKVIGLLAQGSLTVDTPDTFPLEQAREAHQRIEARKTTGKVVLVPGA